MSTFFHGQDGHGIARAICMHAARVDKPTGRGFSCWTGKSKAIREKKALFVGSPGQDQHAPRYCQSLSSWHCESSSGHRILEQATRGHRWPKCFMEEVGRGLSYLCSDSVAGRIGVQHEPFVTGPPAIGFLDERWGGMHRRGRWNEVLGTWTCKK